MANQVCWFCDKEADGINSHEFCQELSRPMPGLDSLETNWEERFAAAPKPPCAIDCDCLDCIALDGWTTEMMPGSEFGEVSKWRMLKEAARAGVVIACLATAAYALGGLALGASICAFLVWMID